MSEKMNRAEAQGGEALFYVQRHASGYVGSYPLFWAEGGNGYTCDLDNAKLFNANEMEDLLNSDKGQKYRAWGKAYIDSKSSRVVDIQRIDKGNSYRGELDE